MVEAHGSSLTKQGLEFELTKCNQNKVGSTITSCVQEADGDSQQLTLAPENNTRRVGEEMHNSKDRCIHKDTLHKNQQFAERHKHARVFEGEPAVKLHV